MSGSKPKGLPTDTVNGIQLGTSCYGKPLPLVYGTTRVAGNIVWMPTELWVKVPGEQGGKGGGGSAGTPDQYYQGLAIAICEGPIVGLGRVWRDKELFATLADVETAHPFNLFTGARPQTPWSYLTTVYSDRASVAVASLGTNTYTITDPWYFDVTQIYTSTRNGGQKFKRVTGTPGANEYTVSGNVVTFQAGFTFNGTAQQGRLFINYETRKDFPAEALGYGGTSYIASERLALGSSNSVKNITYEVKGLLSTGGDVNPADVLQDLLTSTTHGVGWPASRVETVLGPDGTAASGFQRYAEQAGLLSSPALTEQRPALAHIKDILLAANADILGSEGKVKIIPLGDTAVGTFAPYVTPRYALTRDNFIVTSPTQDPVTVTRTPLADTFNAVPVEFTDAESVEESGAYNLSVVEDIDQASADATGLRKKEPVTLRGITRRSVAQKVSRLLAQRSTYRRNVFKFTLDWKFALLEPLDFVTITDDLLGLTDHLVRIRSIEEDPDLNLLVEAEEWPLGTATAPAYVTQAGDGGGQDVNEDPGDVLPPVILAPPLEVTDGVPELWVAAAGATKSWGGAQVWISWDSGASYSFHGDLGPSRYGTLLNDILIGTPIDYVNVPQVDFRASGATPVTVTDADWNALKTAMLIDSEVMAYKTTGLVSAGKYNLSGLLRGQRGTNPTAHSAGALVVETSGAFKVAIDPSHYGSTVYIKLVSFNIDRRAFQDPAEAPIFTFALPSRKQVVPIATDLPVKVTWDRFDMADWEIMMGYRNGVITSVPASGVAGGSLLRCAGGMTWLAHKTLIPFDPSRTYQLLARLRQYAEPSVGGKQIFFGLLGVAEDGVTLVNALGANAGNSQHYLTTTPSTANWVELSGYWKGTAATGTSAGTYAAPGKLHTNVRYVRLLLYMNYDAGNGTQDVDYIGLVEADPTAVTALDTANQATADLVNKAQTNLSNVIAASVTNALLANDAVTTPKIKAGNVVAKSLTITNFDNLWPNPTSEDAPPTGYTPAVNDPEWSARVNLGAGAYAGNWVRHVWFDDALQTGSEFPTLSVPCTPGDQFHFSAWVKGSGSDPGLYIYFQNASGVTIGTAFAPGGYASWTFSACSGTAPAGTVRAVFQLGVYNVPEGNAAAFYADGIYVRRMADGNIIVDGAITALKVAAGAITTAKLAALAVTANELAADAVTATKIAADAVTAAKIAADAVTATKIQAGAVTAAKIAADSLKTTNYASTGSGASEVATAGAKLQNDPSGIAIVTCKDGMKVGALTLEQMLVQMAMSNWRPVTFANITAGAICYESVYKVLLISCTSSSQTYRSTDGGNTWTAVTANGYAGHLFPGTLGRVVALAAQTIAFVSYSGDGGSTWATKACASGYWRTGVFASAAAIPAYVAVNETAAAATCLYSTDGQTWTTKAMPSGQWTDVTYSPSLNRLVAVQVNSATYATSDDGGLTWTSRTFPNSRTPKRVTWNAQMGKFIAVVASLQYNGGTITTPTRYSLVSSDGITWTEANITSGTSIEYCQARLVSAGPAVLWFGYANAAGGSDSSVAITFDGVTWKTVSTGVPGSIAGAAYVPGSITGGTGAGHIVAASSGGSTGYAGLSLKFDPT